MSIQTTMIMEEKQEKKREIKKTILIGWHFSILFDKYT